MDPQALKEVRDELLPTHLCIANPQTQIFMIKTPVA
jgi:hypothetical protein